MGVAQVKTVMEQLDFLRVEDEVGFFSHIPGVGATASLFFHKGLYAGGFLPDWLADTLAEHGVRTWADLQEDDPDSELPPSQRYKLMVIVSDVSRGLMLRLPLNRFQAHSPRQTGRARQGSCQCGKVSFHLGVGEVEVRRLFPVAV